MNNSLEKFFKNYILEKLFSYFPGTLSFTTKTGESFLKVSSVDFYITMFFLKMHAHTQYKLLSDLSVVDSPEKKERFQVFYSLLSIKFNSRLCVLMSATELSVLNSISSCFSGADWFEREAWDMFGLFFSEHNDLRRILTDYGFKGHPLLKEFPLTGFSELQYDVFLSRILYQQITFMQKYRLWVGVNQNPLIYKTF